MDDHALPLAGRTAVVTGAAKRIGRAIALGLGRAGADVVVHYHTSREAAEATAGELESLGRRAWALAGDLAEPERAAALLPRAIDRAGPVDILVNNASMYPKSRVLDFSPDDLAANVQVHAMAPLQLCRAFAAQLNAAGDIVNLLDCRIVDYDAHYAAYHLSKRMLFAITRMLALELAPRIQVNAVAPGLVLPPPGEDEAFLERVAATTPLRRWGSADEVADAAMFLVKSEFVTGQVIFVDGGRHLKGRVYG